jgi:hypothetical protein
LAEPTTESPHTERTAFFERAGVTCHPRPIARGGWGPLMSGHVMGGLLGHAVEQAVDDPDFLPARLTVDLPRPCPLEPVEVRSRVIRSGKRLQLVEAVVQQGDSVVGQATGLFLRRGDQPSGSIWSPAIDMPPVPHETGPANNPLFVRTYGWGLPLQNPDENWPAGVGEKYTWLRLTQPLFDDEPLTPFIRAAMAADVTASLVNWSSEGLKFINADYTLTLSRLPVGPLIGLAAQNHATSDGIATGSAVLFDEHGKIGLSLSTSVAQTGFAPPSA